MRASWCAALVGVVIEHGLTRIRVAVVFELRGVILAALAQLRWTLGTALPQLMCHFFAGIITTTRAHHREPDRDTAPNLHAPAALPPVLPFAPALHAA